MVLFSGFIYRLYLETRLSAKQSGWDQNLDLRQIPRHTLVYLRKKQKLLSTYHSQ